MRPQFLLPGAPLQAPGPSVGSRIPADVWNQLFSWIPGIGEVSQPTALPVVVIGPLGLIFLVVLYKLLSGDSGTPGDDVPEANLAGMLEEYHETEDGTDESAVGEEAGIDATAAGQGETVADLGEHHQNLLSANFIDTDRRIPEVSDGTYIKTLVVTGTPDHPLDGFLVDVFSLTNVEMDMTAHIEHLDHDRMREKTRADADQTGAEAATEGTARASHVAKEAQKMQERADAVEEGQHVFDITWVFAIRGDSQEAVEEAEKELRSTLKDHPARMEAKVFPGKQNLALQTASPLGGDPLGQSDPMRFKHRAVAGSVGALLGSIHNPTFIEPTGFEAGLHTNTRTPIVFDPFERENGHAYGIIADPGAGKSVASKSAFLEYCIKNDDVIGIVIEPLGNWRGVIEAARVATPDDYKAEHVVVGGNKGINPLEIYEIPEHVRQNLPEDSNPLEEKIDDAITFFENFLRLRGQKLGNRRETLEEAIADAYEEAGITENIDTFKRQSPTPRDVNTQLEKRLENPLNFINRHESESDEIQEDAKWLLRRLSPFEEGNHYANLGKQSEIELRQTDMVYLDLGREEGSMDKKGKLTMQLLISYVYELAQATDQKVVIAMDEFRYLMEDGMDLSFLETIFRHQRHHQISPWIMTQTVDEFFDHRQGEAILDMLAVRQFHSLEGMDEEWAKEFRMNEKVMRAIQQAKEGSEERGYSDAVVEIDGEWRQIEVHIPDKQMQVIEWDPHEQPVTDLPGITDDDVRSQTDTASGRKDRTTGPATADGGVRNDG